MKLKALLLLLFMLNYRAKAQESNLQATLDSILAEADLMYRYETAVWTSSDLVAMHDSLKENYGGYILRHAADTVWVTHLSKSREQSIARYTYIASQPVKPFATTLGSMPIAPWEKELFELKLNLLSQLSDTTYQLKIPQGCNPNFVLIPDGLTCRLYMIMGTTHNQVIPLGNDYLFRADLSGKIYQWQRFHSRLLPIRSMEGGAKVNSAIHSHLRTTPYMTATDICTFRLYAEDCGMNEFEVVCTATKKVYTYNRQTNKITYKDI